MKKDLLVYLNTYKRYDSTLPLAILSIINQTYKFDKFIIFDDNKPEDAKDLRTIEHYAYLFRLMIEKGIDWEVRWGQRKGAHFNHETANMEGFKYAFCIDDDCILERDCLENLMKEMKDDVGAVGGLILKPLAPILPAGFTNNRLADIRTVPNIQWYKWSEEPRSVEHIYSSFVYRCNVAHFDLSLSSVAFRGESMFTYEFIRKGYKLLVTPKAITYHFESQKGGCRGELENAKRLAMYNADEKIFMEKMREWGVIGESTKICILNCGLGDTIVFAKSILPKLKKKYKNIILSVCYPEVFPNEQCISIADGNKLVANPEQYNIYAYAFKNNLKLSLEELFREVYEI